MKATLASLALALGVLLPVLAEPEIDKRLFDATFDYVVVGGGTAGLTLAARLSEDPNVQVAVIEPGTYYQITNPIAGEAPAGCVLWAGSAALPSNPLVDWNFITTPQAGALGRKLHYPRGKCLGGS